MPSTELERRRDEARALGRLAFEELQGATGGIGQIHSAVADRVFGYVGPGARATAVAHRTIADGVYRGLGEAIGFAGRATDAALEASGVTRTMRPSASPRGAAVIAAITGLAGDRLERERNELVEPMSVRVDGEVVSPRAADLASAFPDARSRIVVFVHGLMESEFAWRLGSRETGETYGSRLADELYCTPVYVRFNTGRHVSENGQSLANLLEALVAEWPVPVSQIALVGHSMGGLVSRSACYRAAQDGSDWVKRVRHVVSLGSPHMGAPLEQAVHYASAALSALPETRPFAAFLRRRSSGIRDLRQGSLVDADWQGSDPDALRARACEEVPLLEGVTHCFVAATITRRPRHPLARVIGDWLVLEPSASGRSRSRRIPFEAEYGMHVGGASHLALLNHPVVYERLRDWLETPPRVAAKLAA